MTRPAAAHIDPGALVANLARVRSLAPQSRIIAIVKADAYGHGLLRVARALGEADALGVAGLEEALVLREAGIARPVVLLGGPFEAAELGDIARHGLEPVVHADRQLQWLEQASLPRPVPVWLKMDTGMHRLGFAPEAFGAAYGRLQASANVAGIRLMTHLACADERDHPLTDKQLSLFASATRAYEGERSIANSAAVLARPDAHADWVRPGLMLYGASPFADSSARDEGLQPVMSLRTELVAVNRFKKGDSLGYGATWTCPEDMAVGVAAIGYGDGYPRHAPGGTPVLVAGRRAPLVGRVSMDMISVDLRGCPEAVPGSPVELWGKDLPVEEVARSASTIPWQLLCGVTARVRVVE